MWSEEEKHVLEAAWDGGGNKYWPSLFAVATRAVELIAARGGTMTADVMKTELIKSTSGELVFQHVVAQGARVAALEAERDAATQLAAHRLKGRMDAAAEAERLRAERNACRGRAEDAETRLQRMRDGINNMVKRCVEMAKVFGEPTPEERPRTTVTRDTVLLCFACGAVHSHRWFSRGSEQGEGWRCSACGVPSAVGRYPCSPTCTHDGAATPGHPERVKERSEAFTSAIHEEGSRAFHAGRDNGMEAMRAACWEAVQRVLEEEGLLDPGYGPASKLKVAIEGAAP